MWIGAASVSAARTGRAGMVEVEAEGEFAGAEAVVGEKACEATDRRSCEASAGLGDAAAAAAAASGVGLNVAGLGAVPRIGPRNMASIVGRSADPKGVERKSEGKSVIARC